MTKVSVVIPAYNYGRFLGETIGSVLAQTYRDWEMIVVDDGSTDNTRAVVDGFKDPRIRYIYQKNQGVSAAQNTGIKASCGDYIAIQGADDIWLPQNLEVKVARLEARPEIGLVCSDAYLFDSQTGDILGRFWRDKASNHNWVDPERAAKEPLKELLKMGCFIPPQASVIRRAVFSGVGYFDESLRSFEDWDLLVRILRRFPVEIIDKPLVKLRRHGENMSTNRNRMFIGERIVLKKALRTYGFSGKELELLKARQRILAHDCLQYGRQEIREGRITEGREALFTYLKINPLAVRPYIYLALSFLGGQGFLKLGTWKRRMVQRKRKTAHNLVGQGTQAGAVSPPDLEEKKDKTAPKISVVIPTYNYARYLGEAIQSVLGQTFTDFELVIVDDGSTDNTRALVESVKDPRIRYIYQENHGVASAQNKGIKASRGEYIALLGADDMWLPESLEVRAKLLETRPDAGLVCSDIYLFDNNTGANIGRLWHDMPVHYKVAPEEFSRNPLKHLIDWGCFIWPQAALIRRVVFERVGYFDEAFTTCEDWDLFIRMVQQYPIEITDVPLARIRRHGVSLTANADRMYRGEAATLHKLLVSGTLSPEDDERVRRKLAPMHLRYGRDAIRSGRTGEGRKALIAAIRVNPTALKPYLHLGRSFLKSMKKTSPNLYQEAAEPTIQGGAIKTGTEMRLNGAIPKVTVAIPTYNYGRFIGEAIQSVLDQTFSDFELIIVDDGSTDNTRAVVESFKDPRIRYIYQEHSGVTKAENTAHKYSRGEYITGLGADDIYLPRNLELKVKALDARPELALVCSDAYIFDDRTGAILGRRWHDKPFHYWVDPDRAAKHPLRELLGRGCFIAPQTALLRSRAEEEVGMFDESLSSHEDWDLYVRMLKRFPIEVMDTPLIKIRQHGVSMCANWDNIYLGAVKVLNKAINSYSFSGTELKLVKTRLSHTHFSYGKSLMLNGNATLGRAKFLEAIKINPWDIKPYIYLAGSLLGDGAISSVKSWKQHFA